METGPTAGSLPRVARLAVLASLFFCLAVSARACEVAMRQPPSDNFGYASAYGYLNVWVDIGTIDFGGGLEVPVQIEFDSSRMNRLSDFGTAWRCPLLESRALPVSETRIDVELFYGPRLYLVRSRKDPAQFLSQDERWIGRLKGDVLSLSGTGVEFEFIKGLLQRASFDDGRSLVWQYSGTEVTGIREGGGSPAFEVKRDPSSHRVKALVINRKNHAVVVKNGWLDEVGWPDEKKKSFGVSFDKRESVLSVSSLEGKQFKFAWDTESGHIRSEGGWEYTVGKAGRDETPPLARRNSQGQTETFHFDSSKGVVSYRSVDGSEMRRYLIMSRGPTFMRVRKVEKTIAGRTQTTLRQSFDEQGRIIRLVQLQDGKEYVTTYSYDVSGKALEHRLWEETQLKSLRQILADLEVAMSKAIPNSLAFYSLAYELASIHAQLREYESAEKIYLGIINASTPDLVAPDISASMAKNYWAVLVANSISSAIQMKVLANSDKELPASLKALLRGSNNPVFQMEIKKALTEKCRVIVDG